MPDPAWIFPRHFRAHAFGWKATRPASERLREAISEIKAVHCKGPLIAADGAVHLIEKLVPAIQDIDSSSGSLGTARNRALHTLVELIAAAPAPPATRAASRDFLWEAYLDDGHGYLGQLPERWGELCGSPAIAGEWADDLAPTLRHAWVGRSHLRGDTAALSCLLAVGGPADGVALMGSRGRRAQTPSRDQAVRAPDHAGEREAALQGLATLIAPERGPRNWAGDVLQTLLATASRVATGSLG